MSKNKKTFTKEKRQITAGILCLSLSVSALWISGSMTPVMARSVKNDSWTVQLNPQEEETTEITSDLLTKGMSYILLDSATEDTIVTVNLNCQGIAEGTDLAPYLQVESKNTDWLTIEIVEDGSSIVTDGTAAIKLHIQVASSQTIQVEDTEDENEPELQAYADTENATEKNPAEEDPTEESTTVVATEATTAAETEATTESTTEAGTEPTKAPETEPTEESQEASTESSTEEPTKGYKEETITRSETVEAVVIFEYGNTSLCATIQIPAVTETTEATGDLAYCQTQYDPSQVIHLQTGSSPCRIWYRTIDGTTGEFVTTGFPAMTAYRVGENTYLLYQGGSIDLPADARVELDLSRTDVRQDFHITTEGTTSCELTYAPLPEKTWGDVPLILGTESLTIPYQWGSLEPSISIYQQVVTETQTDTGETVQTVTWEGRTTVDAKAIKDTGQIRLTSKGAEAGTYEMLILWIEGDTTLYETKIPFFIQYGGEEQGGTGQ